MGTSSICVVMAISMAMRCIICKAMEKSDGTIHHKKGCPELLRRSTKQAMITERPGNNGVVI